jgi:hypothetical protein
MTPSPPPIVTNAELYDPATGQWTSAGSLVNSRYWHTATLLPNGTVLVAGGDGTNGFLARTELYDPVTGTWSATGNLANDRARGFTATLLPSGRVLLVGGDSLDRLLTSTELYDVGLGFAAAWQPQLSSAGFDVNGRLVLTGARFRGISSASGGNGAQDSPTSYPVVQWRSLNNERSVFLLSDPTVAVTTNGFTSVPVAASLPGWALVTVFANGIPSVSFVFTPPDIAVEQPVGTGLADGGTRNIVATLGTPGSLVFTIKNPHVGNLIGLTITRDGPNASDFTVTANPVAPVFPGGSTTFIVQFAPTTGGTKTAAVRIANNVPGKNPYDINLTGQVLSFTTDTDGDGMSDAAEQLLAPLGFNWQVSQPALVQTYYANANVASLYTASQVQALNVAGPLLQKNPTSGLFTLTMGVQKATDLMNFNPFPMTAPQTLINAQGELEFEFSSPDNAAFFRLESH